MSLLINVGQWGGFYIHLSRTAVRLCLGFVAFTVYSFDMDDLMDKYLPKRFANLP